MVEQKLEPVKQKLDNNDGQITSLHKKLDGHNKKLDEHTDKLDALILDMLNVQKRTDILPDLYSLIKDNKEKTDGLEEKIERLENPV